MVHLCLQLFPQLSSSSSSHNILLSKASSKTVTTLISSEPVKSITSVTMSMEEDASSSSSSSLNQPAQDQEQIPRDQPEEDIEIDEESSLSERISEDPELDSDYGDDEDEDDEEVSTDPSTDENPDVNINLTIADYTIVSKLEASTMYQCINVTNSENYLCNVVNAEQYFNFKATYDRLKTVSGMNQIHQVHTEQGKNLVIYKKTFGDLHEYVKNKIRLSESEAAYFFRQMVTIVKDVHAKGVIVRDLKLRKFVFKDPAKRTIILETCYDSMLLSNPDDDWLSEKYGCPTYASPELIDSDFIRYSGKKADMWSLGVILFAILTGRYPFYHKNPHKLLAKINKGFYVMPDHISPQAGVLIQNLLTKDPSLRIAPIDILNSDWLVTHRFASPSSPPSSNVLPSDSSVPRQSRLINIAQPVSTSASTSTSTTSTVAASSSTFNEYLLSHMPPLNASHDHQPQQLSRSSVQARRSKRQPAMTDQIVPEMKRQD